PGGVEVPDAVVRRVGVRRPVVAVVDALAVDGHVDDVGVGRIDDDLGDRLPVEGCVRGLDQGPGLAEIDRLQNTSAVVGVGIINGDGGRAGLAEADVDVVGVGGGVAGDVLQARGRRRDGAGEQDLVIHRVVTRDDVGDLVDERLPGEAVVL